MGAVEAVQEIVVWWGLKCGLCNTGPSFTFSLLQKVDEYRKCGRNLGGVADLNKNSDGLSKIGAPSSLMFSLA